MTSCPSASTTSRISRSIVERFADVALPALGQAARIRSPSSLIRSDASVVSKARARISSSAASTVLSPSTCRSAPDVIPTIAVETSPLEAATCSEMLERSDAEALICSAVVTVSPTIVRSRAGHRGERAGQDAELRAASPAET